MKGKLTLHISRVLCLAALLGLNSCVHFYYAPSAPHVPLLQNKGEIALNGSLGGGTFLAGVNAQAAYALTNKIGIMATYHGGSSLYEVSNYNSNSGSSEKDAEGTRLRYTEIAGGYFRPFFDWGRFEVYGGGGLGNAFNYFDVEKSITSQAYYHKFFIQPTIGKKGKVFEVAFSNRLATVDYYRFRLQSASRENVPDLEAISRLQRSGATFYTNLL